MQTFLIMLNPMLTMFLCIAVGYILRQTRILSQDSGKVIAKLVTWVFAPALSFSTMAKNFTVSSLSTHAVNIGFSCLTIAVSIGIAILLSRLFVREPSPERGIYQYALTFANFGYMADPIILGMFGDEALAYYKLFTLPASIMVYVWGISVLVPKGADRGGALGILKKIANAPTIAMFLGMIVGITGLGSDLPTFMTSTLDSLKVCMGPMAMLLAGVTVANYSLSGMIKNKKVYVASILRLVVLPCVLVAIVFGAKELFSALFSMEIDNLVIYLVFFFTAMPLGLNTVVFPEAYGGNPETGASMALISNTLGVITIPLLYMLMTVIFGGFPLVI